MFANLHTMSWIMVYLRLGLGGEAGPFLDVLLSFLLSDLTRGLHGAGQDAQISEKGWSAGRHVD